MADQPTPLEIELRGKDPETVFEHIEVLGEGFALLKFEVKKKQRQQTIHIFFFFLSPFLVRSKNK